MTSAWTSRKRVEVALNHQQPDRVPLSMTITEVPYTRLRKHLGLAPDKTTQPNRFGEVNPAFDLLESLGFDTTSIKLGSPETNISLPTEADGTVFDEWGVGRKRIDLGRGAFYWKSAIPRLTIKIPMILIWPNIPGRILQTPEEFLIWKLGREQSITIRNWH